MQHRRAPSRPLRPLGERSAPEATAGAGGLPPALLAAVELAARASGLEPAAWIESRLANALGGPVAIQLAGLHVGERLDFPADRAEAAKSAARALVAAVGGALRFAGAWSSDGAQYVIERREP